MLILKPNCELCDKDLAVDSLDARICSYECTFCANCVEQILQNVCPNCGGGLCQRPIRPKQARRDGVSRLHHPGSTERIHQKYSEQEIKEFVKTTKDIKTQER